MLCLQIMLNNKYDKNLLQKSLSMQQSFADAGRKEKSYQLGGKSNFASVVQGIV